MCTLKFTSISLQTHSQEKEEYLLAAQRPKVVKKKLSSVFKPTNCDICDYYIATHPVLLSCNLIG